MSRLAGELPLEIGYTRSRDGTHIAYQVVGTGPVDLLYVPPGASHLEQRWEEPGYASVLRRLASFCRLISLDKRGSGLSDREVDLPTHEQQVEDIVAVLDAAGSSRTYLFGVLDGAISSLLAAASHPGRVSGVVAYAAFARAMRAEDYPLGFPPDVADRIADAVDHFEPARTIPLMAPSMVGDVAFERWWSRFMRSATSPAAVARWYRSLFVTDIREVVASVRVPVLVLHRAGDRLVRPELPRWLADQLPDGRLVELPGDDYCFWVGDRDALVDAIELFVTGDRRRVAPERMLATVLFTDIVGSTARALELGDARWRRLLDDHDAVTAREVARQGGRVVKLTGDGALATFDGPGRATACAVELRHALGRLGLEVRAGVHTGEIELRGDDVGGLAVHLASRIERQAAPGQVLVSRTVVDLVAGSGLVFEDRGSHELQGIPGQWQLFELVS